MTDNKYEHAMQLKYLVNGNGIFEYDTSLAPLDALNLGRNVQLPAPVPQHQRKYEAVENNLKGK